MKIMESISGALKISSRGNVVAIADEDALIRLFADDAIDIFKTSVSFIYGAQIQYYLYTDNEKAEFNIFFESLFHSSHNKSSIFQIR